MHLYTITLQLKKESFLIPEYFIKRVVYFSKDSNKPLDYTQKIIKYTDIAESEKDLFNSFENMFSNVSSVVISNDDVLKISFIKGKTLFKTLIGNKISPVLNNNIKKMIYYLNNYK